MPIAEPSDGTADDSRGVTGEMSAEDRVEWIKAMRQKHVDFLEKNNNYILVNSTV